MFLLTLYSKNILLSNMNMFVNFGWLPVCMPTLNSVFVCRFDIRIIAKMPVIRIAELCLIYQKLE